VATLGYYSLFLTAFLAGMTVPGRLLFFPYEVAAVAQPAGQRLAFVRKGMLRSVPLACGSAIVAAAVAAVLSSGAGVAVVLPLAASMALATAVSPLQDHARRVLHVDDHSTQAAVVSVVQLVGVLALIFLLHVGGMDPIWIPYLSLAGANVMSLSLGVWFIGRAAGGVSVAPPPFRSVARSGSWLLYISLLGPVVGLAVNSLVLGIAGAVALGLAEAARQVARPLLVVTTGLGMSLRPRSFAAAQRRRRPAARRIERLAIAVTVGAGLAYTAWVTIDWPFNIMQDLIPKAYDLPWLVFAVCISNIVVGIGFPSGYELIGGKKEAAAAIVESVGQAARLALTAFTAAFGAFTIAASDTGLGLARFVGNRVAVRSIYEEPTDERPAETAAEVEQHGS
jgi:O-antigen/teichoic acid export membrane protein